MEITARVKTIDNIDNVHWDGMNNTLTIYHHDNREAMKIKVAHLLRQDDVIDSIDKITLIS